MGGLSLETVNIAAPSSRSKEDLVAVKGSKDCGWVVVIDFLGVGQVFL